MTAKDRPTARLADDDRLGCYAGMRFLFICPGCQHGSEISATSLMKLRGGGAIVNDVLAGVVCTNCGRKGPPNVQVEDELEPSPSTANNPVSDPHA